MTIPRVLVAGLCGGGGKTLISLGILAAWRKQGLNVAPFKKGPDYIDAAWLSVAADSPCRNLDLFLMSEPTIARSFCDAARAADVAVIEGNRGLYDGMNAGGTYSSAELAKLLKVPVLLVVDSTKMTRTAAALVLGCQKLDPQVNIRGVVLNQIAGSRHESVLRGAIEQDCGLPVLGTVPRIAGELFPERHLGLVPPQEHDEVLNAIPRIAEIAEQHLDLQAIWDVAQRAPALEPIQEAPPTAATTESATVRIGVFRDEAFQFYYPENLEALVRAGARLIEVSPLRHKALPEVDALYIGGGFPETLALALAENRRFRDALREQVIEGLPVYAECGGAVYLGRQLLMDQKTYPMAGVLPVDFVFHQRPQGHGYAVVETVNENPFYPVGESLRGHEFHYTGIEPSSAENLDFAFRIRRGYGFDGRNDGLRYRNVLACYTHIHALSVESWAPSLIRAATRCARDR